MAAVLQPHHLPSPAASRRPDLRVLPGGGRPTRQSVGGGLSAAAVVAGLVLLVVLVSAVLGIGRGAFAGLAPAPAASTSPAAATAAPAVGTATVVVRPGDTLWSIARQLQPNGDVRSLVDRLVAANGSSVVAPGDRVAIPR